MKSYQAVYQILAKETDYISGEKIAEELSLSRTSIWKCSKLAKAADNTLPNKTSCKINRKNLCDKID